MMASGGGQGAAPLEAPQAPPEAHLQATQQALQATPDDMKSAAVTHLQRSHGLPWPCNWLWWQRRRQGGGEASTAAHGSLDAGLRTLAPEVFPRLIRPLFGRCKGLGSPPPHSTWPALPRLAAASNMSVHYADVILDELDGKRGAGDFGAGGVLTSKPPQIAVQVLAV